MRAAFDHPVEALTAVAELQSVLEDVSPADNGALLFRAALHCGVADARQGMQGDGYVGPTVLRTDRLLAAAHVGQVLVSAAVVDLLGSALPSPLGLRSLGPTVCMSRDAPKRFISSCCLDCRPIFLRSNL